MVKEREECMRNDMGNAYGKGMRMRAEVRKVMHIGSDDGSKESVFRNILPECSLSVQFLRKFFFYIPNTVIAILTEFAMVNWYVYQGHANESAHVWKGMIDTDMTVVCRGDGICVGY